KQGETMRDISQLYGIKLKKLYKKNLLIMGTQPNVGDKIFLKKKK
ncbi:MAG: LysM peptidoglycan-binding domain-containing protein, partial [Flavobacteriales bacterium]|nr:LysM peptidoglycan-binding domain-containing protein [Flavobacteriales bacterium]